MNIEMINKFAPKIYFSVDTSALKKMVQSGDLEPVESHLYSHSKQLNPQMKSFVTSDELWNIEGLMVILEGASLTIHVAREDVIEPKGGYEGHVVFKGLKSKHYEVFRDQVFDFLYNEMVKRLGGRLSEKRVIHDAHFLAEEIIEGREPKFEVDLKSKKLFWDDKTAFMYRLIERNRKGQAIDLELMSLQELRVLVGELDRRLVQYADKVAFERENDLLDYSRLAMDRSTKSQPVAPEDLSPAEKEAFSMTLLKELGK